VTSSPWSTTMGVPTYSVDLSRAIGALMRNPPGTFHVVNSGSCTWYQFARRIVQLTGGSSTVVPITSSRLNRPRHACVSVLSTRKYTEVTGEEMRSWEEAITEYLS